MRFKSWHNFEWPSVGAGLPEDGRPALIEGIERFLENIEYSIRLQRRMDAALQFVPLRCMYIPRQKLPLDTMYHLDSLAHYRFDLK